MRTKALLGLVAAAGLGYFSLNYSPAQSRRNYVNIFAEFPLEPEWEEDKYKQLVDNLDIVPDWLYTKIPEVCNEEKLVDYHAKSLENVARGEFGAVGNTFLGKMYDLIKVDLQIANCFYPLESMEYQQKINEVLRHFQDVEDYVVCRLHHSLDDSPDSDNREEEYAVYGEFAHIGRVYYYINAIEKAQEYFLRNPYTIEEAIKVIPWERLEPLRDWFILVQDYFKAGKIQWYLGNKGEARELIMASPEFQAFITEVKKEIKKGDYNLAIRTAKWRYRIPFYQEWMARLCEEELECLTALVVSNESSNESEDIMGYTLPSTCGGF
ncbi:MAG: hypothetical protein AABX13_06630 [Nanoarchaeota archaeon]